MVDLPNGVYNKVLPLNVFTIHQIHPIHQLDRMIDLGHHISPINSRYFDVMNQLLEQFICISDDVWITTIQSARQDHIF